MTLRPKHNTYGDILLNRRYPSIHPHAPTAREVKLSEKLSIATAGLEAIISELKKQ